jgi:hypothetical protein
VTDTALASPYEYPITNYHMNSTDKKLYELFPTKDITLTDEFT